MRNKDRGRAQDYSRPPAQTPSVQCYRTGFLLRKISIYYGQACTSWNWGQDLDQFVRRRLRCLAAGRFAKGVWHQLLPNALFVELGLYNLANGYLQAHQGRLIDLYSGTHQA